MKNLYLVGLLTLILNMPVAAQWGSDPDNPMIVSNVLNRQQDVISFPDGVGGLYIFWIDSRNGINNLDVYGQHYNGFGLPQWDSTGKEIVDYAGNVSSFTVRMNAFDESLIIAWTIISSPTPAENGLYYRKMNLQGESLWPSDKKLRDDFSYPNSIKGIQMVQSKHHYYIAVSGVLLGGFNDISIIKLDSALNSVWPLGGQKPIGMSSFGSFSCSGDDNGGLYVFHSTGNGLGASVYCMLVSGTNAITNEWLQWQNVTSGSNGLSGHYSGIGDQDGITISWVGNGPEGGASNIYARRFNASDGAISWNGNTKVITAADGNQERFFWKKKENTYYYVWADDRPGVVGNSAIYAQKMTKNGVILWNTNGIEVANLNTYIPYPKFDLDEFNTMCITHETGIVGLVAHKLTDTGTLLWGPEGCKVFTKHPSYNDYSVNYTGSRFLVTIAESYPSGGTDGIYLNEVKLPKVEIEKVETACNSYSLYNETYTTSGSYTIEHEDSIIQLQLTIISNVAEVEIGQDKLTAINDGEFQWYDCQTGLALEGETNAVLNVEQAGSYALILTNGVCVDTSSCIVILSMEQNEAELDLQLYPNPGNSLVQISLQGLQGAGSTEVCILNSQGALVKKQTLIPFDSSLLINTEDLAPGLYLVRVSQANKSFSRIWLKN